MFHAVLFRRAIVAVAVPLVVSLAPATTMAKSPVIIRHDAHLMDNEVRINLAWQSEEPIAKIIVSAGREQVVVEKDIDNDRNDSGYSGVIDLIVPYSPYTDYGGDHYVAMSQQTSTPYHQSGSAMYASSSTPYREMVQYTVQLVDEVNQRSTLLKDTVRRPDQAYLLSKRKDRSPAHSTDASLDIDVKDPMKTAISGVAGLIGKFTSVPEIKHAKINYWGNSRTSVSIEAIDDRGIDKVLLEIRDSLGAIVRQDTIFCNGDKLCSRESEAFQLHAGKHFLTAIAVDTESNNSKSYSLEFTIQAEVSSQQEAVSQHVPQDASEQTQPESAPVGSVPGF